MAYQEHLLATFRGRFGSAGTPTGETWSFGLRFRYANSPGFPNAGAPATQVLADDMKSDMNAFMVNPGAKIQSNVLFDEVRLYNIDTNGLSKFAPVISSNVNAVTGGATPLHPFQITQVVTLDAGFPAKGRYGRIYLPTSGNTVGLEGLVTIADRDNLLAVAKTFLEDVSNQPGTDAGFGLVVASNTLAGGQLRDVVTIRTGRVMDTQRRRRNQLPEQYAVTPISV